VLVIGSQVAAIAPQMPDVANAVGVLGIPTFLAGMARGLLGRNHPLQGIHNRTTMLKNADFVILAGLPQDFRLGYGRQISKRAYIVSANRSQRDLTLNRSPSLGIQGDPGKFLIDLAAAVTLALQLVLFSTSDQSLKSNHQPRPFAFVYSLC
jgi:thiamine pyrophosphate-dependent acetolactate synthase large subunit-like protein